MAEISDPVIFLPAPGADILTEMHKQAALPQWSGRRIMAVDARPGRNAGRLDRRITMAAPDRLRFTFQNATPYSFTDLGIR